ncbi:MAG: OmpA family protein [Bdellovibrionota bacterium]
MKTNSFALAIALVLTFFVVLSTGHDAHAGMFEIGASGSYRRSVIDVESFDESSSVTGSLSYYFSDATALELSYTDGRNRRVLAQTATISHVTNMYYKTVGLDLVYTAGAQGGVFRPYIKVGAQHILEKRIVDQYVDPTNGNWNTRTTEDPPATVPSAGAGFKIAITQALSLKAGVDAWTSRPLAQEPRTIDYMARIGLSWFL